MAKHPDLVSFLANWLQTQGLERNYWIAYSGGLDSQVLLHVCASLRSQLPIKLFAVHVNHGLHPKAAAWNKYCARVCAALDIPFIEKSISLSGIANASLEAVARNLRYQQLASVLQSGDMLLTAHHQADQAETVLLQLLRGAGPKGLAAMPAIKPLGWGYHARPLLGFAKSVLQTYAQSNQLHWMEDDSNQDNRFTRNFIRNQVLPLLELRWPTITNSLARSAAHCAEVQDLLEEYGGKAVLALKGSKPNTLSISKLKNLSLAQQKLALRTWIIQCGHPLPNAAKLTTLYSQFLTARPDRNPLLSWQNTVIRRYQDNLYILPPSCLSYSKQSFYWDLKTPVDLENNYHLSIKLVSGEGLSPRLSQVMVRFRRGGESLTLEGGKRLSLKKFLQSYAIAPWLRSAIPLLFVAERLIAVGDIYIDPTFKAGEHEVGKMVNWDYRPD